MTVQNKSWHDDHVCEYFYTCAIDTGNVRRVMKGCRTLLIRNHLKRYGILWYWTFVFVNLSVIYYLLFAVEVFQRIYPTYMNTKCWTSCTCKLNDSQSKLVVILLKMYILLHVFNKLNWNIANHSYFCGSLYIFYPNIRCKSVFWACLHAYTIAQVPVHRRSPDTSWQRLELAMTRDLKIIRRLT